MKNNIELDAFRTLTGMADFLSDDKKTAEVPFILAASDGAEGFALIASGEKEKIKQLFCKAADRVADELTEGMSAQEALQLLSEASESLEEKILTIEQSLYQEERSHSGNTEEDDELSDELCEYDDYYYGGYDCYDDDDDEPVKKQIPLSESMQVFAGFLEEGLVQDADGIKYEIVFSCKSRDGSCVYLILSDNEVIENQQLLLAAKYFPDISGTTLFPVTEWEDVALRLERMKQLMYDKGI